MSRRDVAGFHPRGPVFVVRRSPAARVTPHIEETHEPDRATLVLDVVADRMLVGSAERVAERCDGAFDIVEIALDALQRGLGKVAPDPQRIAADLDDAWEVLGEAVQTVLRAAGVPDGYELLKDFTRGRRIDQTLYREFVATLPLPTSDRERLSALRPADYLGLASELAIGQAGLHAGGERV